MSEKTVLVIDDSATIRRFVDNELSSAGYRVALAGTAEEGMAKAAGENPDLIILDHQLPGTTGYEVCCQLLADPELAKIPVVASSTLRKKAYAEYVDCDNVVDMLPKPYQPEVLIATVGNAIETAAMVVESQSHGSAVPEVIDELGESDLAGTFGCFGLRELLDLLNNGEKSGVLEVETSRCRVLVHVDRGRVQAVTGTGINPDEIQKYMPDSLSELGPVLKFTLTGRRGTEVDGLVDLLDTKVLDPRLLRKLLRVQAAMLLRICFKEELKSFRFDRTRTLSPLYQKLPLDSSLLALLVEGALACERSEIPELQTGCGFSRRAIRGQNLDRAGLSSRHMKLMNVLDEVVSAEELAVQLGWEFDEVVRVLHGFELAELVEQKPTASAVKVAVVSGNQELNQRLAIFFSQHSNECQGKLVRDWSAAELLLKRMDPHVLLIEVSNENSLLQLEALRKDLDQIASIRVLGVCDSNDETLKNAVCESLDMALDLGFEDEELLNALRDTQPEPVTVSVQQEVEA